MKKYLIAALSAIAISSAGLPAAQETQGPKIVVKDITYDFGAVTEGDMVSHVFEIESAGSEQLVIERIQTS